MTFLVVGVLVVLAGGSWMVQVAATRPVRVGAVDTFAMRQRLHLPAVVHDAVVLRYLATTRRWRVSGLVVVFVFAVGVGLRSGKLTADLGAAFLGWFTGAVVAEWRFNTPPTTARRTAALTRRTLRQYLRRREMIVPSLAIGVLAAMAGYGATHAAVPTTVAVLGASLIVVTAAALTARRVLQRAVADSTPAVDHALRSRSLHALAGAVTAHAVTGAAIVTAAVLPVASGLTIPLAIIAGGLVVGWLVGTARGPAS